jgi:predicted heme/steroid binding protein
MGNAVNAMVAGQVYIVIKLYALQIAREVPVSNQMSAHVNLDGKVYFVTLVFAVNACTVFALHLSNVNVFMDMKAHTAIFQ